MEHIKSGERLFSTGHATPPVAAWQAGESQRAEAYGTLGAGGVELLTKCLQVAQGGGPCEPFSCTPQERGTT